MYSVLFMAEAVCHIITSLLIAIVENNLELNSQIFLLFIPSFM